MLFDQITIVGVGLIGGSVGLAAKARGVARRVVGIKRGHGSTEDALRLGAVDAFADTLAEGVRTADLVVVCTPVDRIAEVVIAAANHGSPGLLITDGGSTKANIVAAVEGELPEGVGYVPAHPLAGSEKNGVRNARADLFENRLTVLTPTGGTEPTAVERVEAFWQAVGSRVVRLSPAQHDQILAATSHLPHAAAAALAGVTPVGWLDCAAGGFRDTTRVAAGDPHLWAAIFQANRDSVLAAVDRFVTRLDAFRALLEAGDRDGLVRWLSEAKQVRDALGT